MDISAVPPAAPRVLVVEDDPDTRRLLVAALAEEGYEPIPALDGRHALRTAVVSRPSAIVLDLMLPEADGAEFVRELSEKVPSDSTPPILVVSGRRDAAMVADRIGADAYVAKPFQIGDLIDRLAEVIRVGGKGARVTA